MQRNKVLFAQKEVMKDPTSLDANIKWVWSLICGCKVKQAIQAFSLLEKKKTQGLIRDADDVSEDFDKLQNIIGVISGEKSEKESGDSTEKNLLKIAELCHENKMEAE